MRAATRLGLALLLGLSAAPALAGSPPPEPPARFSARVVGVADGDTVTVLWGRTQVVVRLKGIDAPEKAQAFGKRAKQALAGLVHGRTVGVEGAANDRYGRRLAVLRLPDGRSANREMVRLGLAWHYVRYSDDADLAALERAARAARRGLWADPRPTPPWEFRHPPARPAEAPPPGAVVGNKRSRIYHAPGCPDREKVSVRNRELFATEAAAAAAGYRRARNCPRR